MLIEEVGRGEEEIVCRERRRGVEGLPYNGTAREKVPVQTTDTILRTQHQHGLTLILFIVNLRKTDRASRRAIVGRVVGPCAPADHCQQWSPSHRRRRRRGKRPQKEFASPAPAPTGKGPHEEFVSPAPTPMGKRPQEEFADAAPTWKSSLPFLRALRHRLLRTQLACPKNLG